MAEDACSVVVVYDEISSRDRAVSVCHRLVQRFWEEVEFKIDWLNFRYLAAPDIANHAAGIAAAADMIVFSVASSGELPAHIQKWNDTWVEVRQPHKSVLVLLNAPAALATERSLRDYLRDLAKLADMDFLCQPAAPSPAIAAAARATLQRQATQLGEVLTEILERPPRPPQWGINE